MNYNNEEQYILDFVKGFVNDIDKHIIDTDALLPEIQDIINSIEDLAMLIEEGKFEKIPY
jgi:hypothetical protein